MVSISQSACREEEGGWQVLIFVLFPQTFFINQLYFIISLRSEVIVLVASDKRRFWIVLLFLVSAPAEWKLSEKDSGSSLAWATRTSLTVDWTCSSDPQQWKMKVIPTGTLLLPSFNSHFLRAVLFLGTLSSFCPADSPASRFLSSVVNRQYSCVQCQTRHSLGSQHLRAQWNQL